MFCELSEARWRVLGLTDSLSELARACQKIETFPPAIVWALSAAGEAGIVTEDTAGVVVGVGVTTARQHKASPALRGRRSSGTTATGDQREERRDRKHWQARRNTKSRASTKMKDLQQWRSSPASRSQYIRSDYYL